MYMRFVLIRKFSMNIFIKVRTFIINMSLFNKIFYGTTLIVFAIILVSSFTLYSYSLKIYENEATDNTKKLLEFINTNIEDNLKRVDQTFNTIYSTTSSLPNIPTIRKIVSTKEYSSAYDEFISISIMKDFFQQLVTSMNDLNSIYVYISKDKHFIYSKDSRLKDNYNPEKEEWYKATVAANGKTLVFPPHEYYNLESNENVISYSKLLINMSDSGGDPYGVVLMDFSLNSLERIVKNTNLSANTGVLFLSGDEEVIYSNDYANKLNIGSNIIFNLKNSDNGKLTTKIYGEKCLITYNTSELTGWKIVMITPYTVVAKDTYKFVLFCSILILVALAFTLVIAYVFSVLITKPIKKLHKGMSKLEKGNFDFQLESSSDDELGQLIQRFNMMVKTIKDLILKEYEERIARKNAEYKYLEAQINPHFIYNTLQVVSSMSAVREAPEIERVSSSLASILRYSVSNIRDVTIRDEIKNVVSYLEIQQLRFSRQLTFEVNVDENIYNYKAMKLMLQPIVENAINHGIRKKNCMGLVQVLGYVRDNTIYLEVHDDGVGMDEEEVQQIIQHINHKEDSNLEKSGSIGLRNIHMRIGMEFGSQYGILIESKKNVGSKVSVKLPAVENNSEARSGL